MPERTPGGLDRVRTAELIGALSLATDLGIGVSLEYGLHSTIIAMRLGESLGIDPETASQTYFGCLLIYVGCTAGAEVEARIFGEDHALTTYGAPSRFGSRPEMMAGLLRAVAPPGDHGAWWIVVAVLLQFWVGLARYTSFLDLMRDQCGIRASRARPSCGSGRSSSSRPC